MSHDETSDPMTRKERRAARGGRRQPAPRHVFSADEHVRIDWSVAYCIEFLEARAPGYNGTLRQILCTSAQRLREQEAQLDEYRKAYEASQGDLEDALDEMRVQGELDEMAAEEE